MGTTRSKSRSIIGIAFTMLLVISMVPFGMDLSSRQSRPVAITVNDTEIDYGKFEREQLMVEARLRQQFGEIYEQLSKSMNIRSMTKDQMIDNQLLLELADKLGIATGDTQLAKGVRTFFGENFSNEMYASFLTRFGLTAKEFETDLRDKIKLVSLSSMLEDFNTPSQKELATQAEKVLSKVELEYLSFDPKSFIEKVMPAEDEKLKQIYEKESAKYELPAKVSYNYLVVDQEEAKKLITLTDADLETYYTENISKYSSSEQVNLGLIKLTLPTDGNPESIAKVRTQANDIVAQLKTGKKFAELAGKHSQDASKSKGGDLGWVKKDDVSSDLAEIYFSSFAMGIVKPVEKNGAIYILDVRDFKDAEEKKFADVKDEIKSELQNQNLAAYLSEYANKQLEDLTKSKKSLVDFSSKAKVKEISAEEPKEFPGLDALIISQKDSKINLNELGTNYIISEIKEFQSPSIPEFAVVKEKILEEYRQNEAKKLAEKSAKDAVDAIKKITLQEYAKKNNLKLDNVTTSKDKPESFTLKPQVFDEIWKGKKATAPVDFESKFFVWTVNKINKPDENAIKEKAKAEKSAIVAQSTGLMIRSLVNSLKKNAEIKLDSALEKDA